MVWWWMDLQLLGKLGLNLTDLWWAAAACVSLSAVSFLAAVRFLRRARIIENTPTARVFSAPQGYIELEGMARAFAGEPLLAPMSLTPCVWYHYTIEEFTASGFGRKKRWRVIQRDTSDSLFTFQDGSGECLIDPEGAEVSPLTRQVWSGNSAVPGDALIAGREVLTSLGVAMGLSRYRFTEERIHPDDPLYVLGSFRTVTGDEELPDPRSALRELLREWKQSPELMARFDTDKDGQISSQEWERVVAAAKQQLADEFRQAATLPAHHVVSKPKDGRPYLLSATAQPKLLGKYRWRSAAAFSVFAVSGSAAAWLLEQLFRSCC